MPRPKVKGVVERTVAAVCEELRQVEISSLDDVASKYGFEKALEFDQKFSSVPFYWPSSVRSKLLSETGVSSEIACLFKEPTSQSCDDLLYIGPPRATCIMCQCNLNLHNKPAAVKYYSASGAALNKKKISLRCPSCRTIYGYSKYGNKKNGFKFYPERRDAVEANDSVFFSVQLMKLQFSFAQHCWVSFEGFTEAWRDANSMNKSEIFDRRVLADAFWWYNIESELRETSMDFKFFTQSDREACMVAIDSMRQQSLYPHPAENCHEDCKARGCGKLWVTDGIWKTQFAHCMWQLEVKADSLPIVNLPGVCTNETKPGKAFCAFHCDLIKENDSGVPTSLKDFVAFCNNGDPDGTDSTESDDDDVLQIASEHSYAHTAPTTCLDEQCGQTFLKDNSKSIRGIVSLADTANSSRCSKDLGQHVTLRKMSRGHQFVVRAGGHIDAWSPLYQSESVGQVFLILVTWLHFIVKDLPLQQWKGIWLAYDNMCQLVRTKASSALLPLPAPYDSMWQSINKIVDGLHIKNHVDTKCHTELHPDNFYDMYPELRGQRNTQAAEQTFVWLGRFKKIVCSMTKTHHLFYLHRMVKHRNEYNVRCYHDGKKPLLPSVRNSQSS